VGRDLRRISGMGLRWTRAFGRLAGIRTHWRSLTLTEYSLDDSSQTEPAARPKDRERPVPIILTDHAALRRSVAVNEKHGNRPRYVAIFGGGIPYPCRVFRWWTAFGRPLGSIVPFHATSRRSAGVVGNVSFPSEEEQHETYGLRQSFQQCRSLESRYVHCALGSVARLRA
jgi:hypothetical protein